MSLLKSIIEAQGGQLLKQLAGNFNLNPQQAGAAVGQLLPALTGGLKKNMASADGLGGLMSAIQSGGHQRYLDNPEELTRSSAVNDGNGILGHLLGSKDASRQVAAQAAEKTGLDVGILKKMLPMVAAMAMGGVSKQAQSDGLMDQLKKFGGVGGMPNLGKSEAAGATGMLSKFLDADGDGSVLDDVMGMAKKFL